MIYLCQDGYPWSTLSTVTNDVGNYSLTWNFTSPSTYYVRARLNGFSDYAGSDSETLTVFVGSQQLQAESSLPEDPLGGGTYYASSPISAFPGYMSFVNQSGEEFLESNLTGTDVVLSGEFMILRGGQTVTVSQNYVTTEVEGWGQWGIRSNGSRYVRLPDIVQTVTTTKINETMTDQFGFILQQCEGNNYTASVKVLNDNDLSKVTTGFDGNDTALMNATMDTHENTWYKVIARISEDAVTTELYSENGTLIRNTTAEQSAPSVSESGILMSNATVVAFRNLNAETVNHPAAPANENQRPANGPQLFAPYNGLVILLAVAVAAMAFIKERKGSIEKKTI